MSDLTTAQLVSLLRQDLEHVGKDSDGQHGPVRGVDDVFDAIGPLCKKHGVTIRSECTGYEVVGGKQWMVAMSYWWVGPDGSQLQFADGMPAVMMNLAAAQSVAYRQALLQALCIPTGENEENDHPQSPPVVERQAVVKSAEARAEQIAAKAKANPKTAMKAVQRNIAEAVVKSAEARAEQIAAKAKANPKTAMKAVQRNIAEAAGIDLDVLTDDGKATLNQIWNQSGCANGGWKDAAKVTHAINMAREGEPF